MTRIVLAVIAALCSIANLAYGQQWQTVFYVDSRVGYSSNTYLNPYLSEWDRSVASGYGTVTVMGQTAWFDDKNVAEFTAGAVFEPVFGQTDTWKGGLGLINYRRKFTDNLTGGIETGASYFSSSYQRTLLWAQPTLSWFPTPFTNIKVKAGTNYRHYNDYVVDSVAVNSKDQTGLYALELETWPSFQWRLSAGLYGSLATLPSVGRGFRSTGSATHIFEDGESLRFTVGIEQYRNEFTTTVPDGGGGFPPVGGPSGDTEIVENTNRIFRLGVEANYPLNQQLSLFLNVEGLQYHSDAVSDNLQDIQVSGGVRLTFNATRFNNRGGIEPDWQKNDSRQEVQIRYAGEGQLYLVGDFNNWQRPGIPLVEQGENRYVAHLDLEMGSYEYKVLEITGGEEGWISFSENIYTVDDGYGGENAMLLIEE
ncbi:glycogen-binding domain-containing protein [Aliifodinibius sp. S!AR15-10]|uniref:glycogen-binding domain-containing protein n=1 Tax=Aliifodinibius sp. S!AR15-10 TaxID=2950437 RepID=UPI00285858FE|nr:glycogen-binding domain-containing protein [Aliifodinibius sp. S!AR15-10]MDR8390300.1 glycogen-binding domain-containing protein [Aliifodinibius sp. S!AR15-10]